MRLVSSLSEAISTAMCRVSLVIVAWMRFWYLPCPNWTRLWLLSRSHGMSRSSAARTSAAVLGPSARRCVKRMNSSRAVGELEARRQRALGPQLLGQQRVEQRSARRPASRPTSACSYW